MRKQALAQLENELSLSQNEILIMACSFQEHMKQGLSGRANSLKMFPAYLQAPGGHESGVFLALDFGGSNVRASVVELKGEGEFQEFSRVVRPLSDPASGRDYRAESVTAEELFDFLAEIIQEVLTNSSNPTTNSGTSEPIPLGFAFSFPYRQQRINQGILLNWDKEVKTSGVVGKDVGQLLSAALARRGLGTLVKSAAIINDTTATFLAAAYHDPSVEIASIIGTGHNTCYLEQNAPGFAAPVIINTESGNFSEAPATVYDHKLDQESDNPGEQKFEKMLSGKYLGELFRLIVLDFSDRGVLERWNQPYSISGKDLALILAGQEKKVFSGGALPEESKLFVLRRIARMLTKRSAWLVASSLIGIIQHLDPHFERRHTVAIDGSLYEGMPGYAQELTNALNTGLGGKADLITVKLSAGGSLTGAAIAAALAEWM